MAMKLDIASPGSFRVIGEQTNLNKAWEQYLKRFEIYIKAANITNDGQKRALLFHVAGMEVQDIFETFADQGTSYAEAVAKLSEYFQPKKNISYERHVFHKAKQQSEETIDNYVVRLSKLAISCEFGDKNEMIRDQIVNSCASSKLRKKLLEEKDLTLDKIQTLSRTFELSATHAKKMDQPWDKIETVPINHGEVNRVNQRPSRGRQRNPGTRVRETNPQNQPRRFAEHGGARHCNDASRAETTAICYRCGNKGHYGRNCEKTKKCHLLFVWRKKTFG